MAEGNQRAAFFGYSVATAGDVNGDGFDDAIVGAYQYDNGQDNEGRSFAYHGSTSGLHTAPDWTAESDQTGAYFGYSVATAGDVNGDGFDDAIVGAYSSNNSPGRAFAYYGSASGLSLVPDWTAESDQAGALLGLSVRTAGDVNGDGFDDVVVGAPGFENGQDLEGGVFVYHGSASGLSLTPSWTAQGDQEFGFFGWSVGTAGDVNGDGYDDLVVGANGYYLGKHAFVYQGSVSGLSSVPAWTADNLQINDGFGGSVGTAGDVNGDGFNDVIVAAPSYNDPLAGAGRAFVYHGSASGLSLTPNWTAGSHQLDAWFGYSLGRAGDVDGDGFDDAIVGALWYDHGQLDEGAAFVFGGSANGLRDTHPLHLGESNQAIARFGVSVGMAGDVDGDGFDDMIVGADWYDHGETDEGVALVFPGRPTA